MENEPIHVRPGTARGALEYLIRRWGEDTSTIVRRCIRESAEAERIRELTLTPQRYVADMPSSGDAEINRLRGGPLVDMSAAEIAREIEKAQKQPLRFGPQG